MCSGKPDKGPSICNVPPHRNLFHFNPLHSPIKTILIKWANSAPGSKSFRGKTFSAIAIFNVWTCSTKFPLGIVQINLPDYVNGSYVLLFPFLSYFGYQMTFLWQLQQIVFSGTVKQTLNFFLYSKANHFKYNCILRLEETEILTQLPTE